MTKIGCILFKGKSYSQGSEEDVKLKEQLHLLSLKYLRVGDMSRIFMYPATGVNIQGGKLICIRHANFEIKIFRRQNFSKKYKSYIIFGKYIDFNIKITKKS